MPDGPRTVATLKTNVVVGVQYLEAWLGGLGCVPLYNLMEDAATAEICRTQVYLLSIIFADHDKTSDCFTQHCCN